MAYISLEDLDFAPSKRDLLSDDVSLPRFLERERALSDRYFIGSSLIIS